jgi:Zn-dependent peptidase ImmA (M78 family)
MNNSSVRAPVERAKDLPIKNIYKRLAQVGFKKKFVQKYALPDWWDDELSADPTSLAMAEISISRLLRVSIEAMRLPDEPLYPNISADFRLKKLKNADVDGLAPAIAIAQSIAESMAAIETDLSNFKSEDSAEDVRNLILQWRPSVDLEGLLTWAWSSGIMVAHVKLPKDIKKFTAIAIFASSRPVILLGAGKTSPASLAFHLAHEIGHLLLHHVRPDRAMLDIEVGFRASDFIDSPEQLLEENAANEFAIQLLTGLPELTYKPQFGLTAQRLVTRAREVERDYKICAGTFALIYGHTADRMPVAQIALKSLESDKNGQQIIDSFAKKYIPDDLPESIAAALQLIGIEQDTAPCLLPDF